MNVIKVLPPYEAQKIAAGEVVERPVHILKELVENSIDAGASEILIWIEQAGKKLIRVVDNGLGMNEQDANICFLPHATSKIRSLEDLYTVQSYGFRGEALASIAAVSKVKLTTRLHDDQSGVGVLIEYYEGSVQDLKHVACPVGTDIAIHDLFYTVPVRKKFLKSDDTEWNQIQTVFQAFCLSHLSIGFKLYHNNKLIINAPVVTGLKDRVAQIWDYDLTQNLIPLEAPAHNAPQYLYTGLISTHQFWRYGRTHMFFFVNNRWIKNQELSKALLKGYLNVLPPGRFPAAFVFLQIGAHQIDVNVHPKKEEVRFIKPITVSTHLFENVKNTLENHVNKVLQPIDQKQTNREFFNSSLQPQAVPFEFKREINQNHVSSSYKKEEVDWDALFALHTGLEEKNSPVLSQKNTEFLKGDIPEVKKIEECVNQQMPLDLTNPLNTQSSISSSFSIVGQLFKTYILIQSNDQLIIVDQHAAHERVLYEKFLKRFQHKEGTVLLFPEIVHLDDLQMNRAEMLVDFFADQGIIFEQFGASEIAFKTSPPLIAQHDLKDLLLEAISFMEEHEGFLDIQKFSKKLNEFTHSHMACKAAVKAGDALEQIFMYQLISDLMTVENRFICVHGRPTMWTISRSLIEKNFRRH